MRYTKSVALSVLNYKNWQDTLECLESIQQIDYPDFQIIVVDNNSQNESIERIKEWTNGELKIESNFVEFRPEFKPVFYVEYDKETAEDGGTKEKEDALKKYPSNRKMVIIQTVANLGYSGGNNVGAKYAIKKKYDYIVLLNNDAIIQDKDFLSKLIEPLEFDDKMYAVGPKIITPTGDYDGPYIYESFWGEFIGLTLRNQLKKLLKKPSVYIDIKAISSPKPVSVYKISGACMVFKSSFLEEIGYLDENVWLSCEEAIIAERVLKAGGKIYFQPLTQIIHKKAKSPRNDTTKIGILKSHFKQRQYFLKTYRGYGLFKMSLIKLMHTLRLYFEQIKA